MGKKKVKVKYNAPGWEDRIGTIYSISGDKVTIELGSITLSRFTETKSFLYEKDKLLYGIICLLPIVCSSIAGKVGSRNQCGANVPCIHVLSDGIPFVPWDIHHLQ